MYYMFVKHNMSPSAFRNMKPGERIVCRAFMLKEVEENKAAQEEIKKAQEKARKGG